MKATRSFLWIETTRFFFLLSLVFSFACSTTHEQAMSDADKCNAEPGNTWVKGRCLSEDSAAAAQQTCENLKDGSQFIDEKCVPAEDLIGLNKQCINNFGAGYYWGQDPKTGEAACLSPKTTLTPEQLCVRDKTAIWSNGICYTKAAAACVKGGDIWTTGKTCITPAENACLAKQDGSTWTNGQCVSVAQTTCVSNNGPSYTWNATTSQCVLMRFVDYCNNPAVSADILQTVNAVKSVLGSNNASCSAIEAQLEGISTLEIDGQSQPNTAKVKNLAPLASYSSLMTLNLPNNQISDLW